MQAAYVPGSLDKAATIEHIAGIAGSAVLLWARGTQENESIQKFVVERPQTYRGRSAEGDTNDLLDLSIVVGCIVGQLAGHVELVRPAQWKGQVPKKTVHGTNPIELRSRGKLYAGEGRIEIPNKKLAHNVWDAIGIGLWYLRR